MPELHKSIGSGTSMCADDNSVPRILHTCILHSTG